MVRSVSWAFLHDDKGTSQRGEGWESCKKRGASGQSGRECGPIINVGEVVGMEVDSTRHILSKRHGEVWSWAIGRKGRDMIRGVRK